VITGVYRSPGIAVMPLRGTDQIFRFVMALTVAAGCPEGVSDGIAWKEVRVREVLGKWKGTEWEKAARVVETLYEMLEEGQLMRIKLEDKDRRWEDIGIKKRAAGWCGVSSVSRHAGHGRSKPDDSGTARPLSTYITPGDLGSYIAQRAATENTTIEVVAWGGGGGTLEQGNDASALCTACPSLAAAALEA
jgi:hypothetical protein